MTTFTTSDPGQSTRPDVEAYVRRCVSYFEDLPLEVRVGLEHDVREIVSEVTAELDGDPADLIGSPQRFAADLRGAAGLPPLQEESDHDATHEHIPTVFVRFLRRTCAATGPWLRRLANELRPAWWVARGFGLAIVFDHDHLWNGSGLIPDLLYSNLLGLVATLILIVGSVQVGRRGRPKTSLSRVVIGLLSLLAVAMLFQDLNQAAFARYGSFPTIIDTVATDARAVEVLPYTIAEAGTFESSFIVRDSVTGETLFRSTDLVGDELLDVLESTSLNSTHGFLIEAQSGTGVVQGTVPTWEGVIALAEAYSEPSIPALPESIEAVPAK